MNKRYHFIYLPLEYHISKLRIHPHIFILPTRIFFNVPLLVPETQFYRHAWNVTTSLRFLSPLLFRPLADHVHSLPSPHIPTITDTRVHLSSDSQLSLSLSFDHGRDDPLSSKIQFREEFEGITMIIFCKRRERFDE